MTDRLIRNALRCNACGDVIESKTLHDFRRCRCGQATIDGGLVYARYGFGDAGVTDLSEIERDPIGGPARSP